MTDSAPASFFLVTGCLFIAVGVHFVGAFFVVGSSTWGSSEAYVFAAWFLGFAYVGVTIVPLLLLQVPSPNRPQRLARALRMALATSVLVMGAALLLAPGLSALAVPSLLLIGTATWLNGRTNLQEYYHRTTTWR